MHHRCCVSYIDSQHSTSQRSARNASQPPISYLTFLVDIASSIDPCAVVHPPPCFPFCSATLNIILWDLSWSMVYILEGTINALVLNNVGQCIMPSVFQSALRISVC